MQAMREDLGKRLWTRNISKEKINNEYEAMENEIFQLKEHCSDLKKQLNKSEDHSRRNNLTAMGIEEANGKKHGSGERKRWGKWIQRI